MKRAEFLRSCGRSLVLGVLGFLGIRAASRARGIDRDAHRCINKSVCCGCPKFEKCPLPAAATARLPGAAREDARPSSEVPDAAGARRSPSEARTR